MDSDDDVLVREPYCSSGAADNAGRPFSQAPLSSQEDKGSDSSSKSLSQSQTNKTRRGNHSSNRRRGDSETRGVDHCRQSRTGTMDSAGVFEALATMLNFKEDDKNTVESSIKQTDSSDVNAAGNSPSSISSVSASLDECGDANPSCHPHHEALKPTFKAKAACTTPISHLERIPASKERTKSASESRKTMRSRKFEHNGSEQRKRKKTSLPHHSRSIVGSRYVTSSALFFSY